MKLKIEVTQDDISTGIQGNCRSCPIAIAMRRNANIRKVIVGPQGIRLKYNSLVTRTIMPIEAQVFITDFDSGRPVQPFSFEVEI